MISGMIKTDIFTQKDSGLYDTPELQSVASDCKLKNAPVRSKERTGAFTIR